MLKAIVFGVMEGKARKGRPCLEWTDDITDWCKEDLHTLRWKATDRTEWQRVVRHAIDTNVNSLSSCSYEPRSIASVTGYTVIMASADYQGH